MSPKGPARIGKRVFEYGVSIFVLTAIIDAVIRHGGPPTTATDVLRVVGVLGAAAALFVGIPWWIVDAVRARRQRSSAPQSSDDAHTGRVDG